MLNDQKVSPNVFPLNHHLLTCVQNFLVFKVYGFLYNPCERHQFARMNHRPRVWLNPSIVTSSNEPCSCSELGKCSDIGKIVQQQRMVLHKYKIVYVHALYLGYTSVTHEQMRANHTNLNIQKWLLKIEIPSSWTMSMVSIERVVRPFFESSSHHRSSVISADSRWLYLKQNLIIMDYYGYPLVNVYINMENHHFSWENPRTKSPFSIAILT